jgi:transcriptional regulator with XRE-family HTH domain
MQKTEAQPTVNLRALRHLKGLSLKEAAAIAGIHYANLSKLERGMFHPSLRSAYGLHRLYGIDVEFWETGVVHLEAKS